MQRDSVAADVSRPSHVLDYKDVQSSDPSPQPITIKASRRQPHTNRLAIWGQYGTVPCESYGYDTHRAVFAPVSECVRR